MKVQHAGSEPVYLVALGDWVQPKQEIEVSDEVGQSLVEQGWVSARSRAAKRVARKRAAAAKKPTRKRPVKAAPQTEPTPEPTDEAATADQED